MRRLAPVLTVAVLTLRAPAALAEPLDVDLSRLGAPDERVWTELAARGATLPGGVTAEQLATQAKERFAIFSSELALALSGPILMPASTTGHAGFDVAFEGSYTPVHGDALGVDPGNGFSNEPWGGASTPSSLTTTGVHVRKALPFSFEMGGRLTYLNRSSYYAAQGEAKWALNEGFRYLPDVAVRFAYTRLFGQQDLNLGATDLDLLVSKRWGVNAVTSFTPYAAARFTFVNASSERIDFDALGDDATPDERYATTAAFPTLRVGLYRTTVGVRMTAYAISLAAEATYFGGKDYSGEAGPVAAGDYGDFELDAGLSAAFRLGWEF
jgi:hypothetical protein